MSRYQIISRSVLLLFLALLFAPSSLAQVAPTPAVENGTSRSQTEKASDESEEVLPPNLEVTRDSISPDVLNSLIEGVQLATTFEEPIKNRILSDLGEMLASLENLNAWKQEILEYEKGISEAPGLAEVLKADLAAGEVGFVLKSPDAEKSTAIRETINQIEADLDAAQTRLETLIAEPETRETRRTEIPQRIAEVKQQSELLATELEALPEESPNEEYSRLNRLRLQLSVEALNAEAQSLEGELALFAATQELNLLRQDRVRERILRLEQAKKDFEARFTQAKEQEDFEAAAAAKEALDSHLLRRYKEIGVLAEQTQEFVNRRGEIGSEIEQLRVDLERNTKSLESVTASYESSRRRAQTIENSGAQLGRTIGLLLRAEKEKLLDLEAPRQRIRQRQGGYTEFQVERLQLEEFRKQFIETRARKLNGILEEIRNDPIFKNRRQQERAEEKANAVFNSMQETMDGLLASYRDIIDVLFESNRVDLQLSEQIEDFRQYIDERILWIQSSKIFNKDVIAASFENFEEITSLRTWQQSREILRTELLIHRPIATFLLGLFFVSYLITIPIRKKLLATMKDRASDPAHYDFWVTIQVLFSTLWAALPLPLIMGFFGSSLITASAETSAEAAIGHGLLQGAILFFPLYLLLKATQANGLGEVHLGWTSRNARLLRKHTRWFLPLGVLILLLTQYVESFQSEQAEARVLFPLWLISLSIYLFTLFRPTKGLESFYDSTKKPGSVWTRLRLFLILLLPASFALASILGFHYTAWQLTSRLLLTFALFIAAFFLQGIALNWIYLSRRRIASQLAEDREDEPREDLELVDLQEVQEQSKSLLKFLLLIILGFSIWSVWTDVLPALNVLDRVELWQVEAVDRISSADSSIESSHSQRVEDSFIFESITLADLAMAFLILFVVWVVTRNLAGLFGMTIFQLMKSNPGENYAITTICQYLITLIGFMLAFAQIGITWGTVQWLAAAISLGIGFGLQEIVANFVSGIILLFERPIRVGDIVTAGDVTGKVSRIQIRATTVTDWDNKELIVPNKEFVTNRVLNWTLTEARIRLVITVGIAYGSDVQKARELLFSLCAEEPRLLKDPEPSVTFENFGDSTLDLILRAHLPDLDNLLAVKNDMHTKIHDSFNKAGIEIAFPQRDLHIRTLPLEMQGVTPVTGSGESK